MGTPSDYRQEIVHWNPRLPGQRKRPDVQFECVTSPGDPTGGEFGLTITGFAEGEPSRLAAVAAAEERGEWMAVTGLRFDQLPPTPANMERMAEEGVQFLADHFGHGVLRARLRTNSLSAVALLGVEKARGLFSEVSSLAPFPLVNEHLGRLPFLGSSALTRRADVAVRLGLITPLQLAHRVFDGGVREMPGNAKRELIDYGDSRNFRLDYGFHPARGRRVADAAVSLMLSHNWFGVFGRQDALVRRGPAAASLRAAAVRAGLDPSIVDARIVTAPGPHAPLSSKEGLRQFHRLMDGLPQPETAVQPSTSGLLRQLGTLTRRLAA